MADPLAAICDDDGVVRVVAIDHRDSLTVMLPDVDAGVGTGHGAPCPDSVVVALKAALVAAVAGRASGVMLDPRYGMMPEVLAVVPQGVGIIAALEAQGYLADETVTHTTLLPDWSAAQAGDLGADLGKLLALWAGAPDAAQQDVVGDAVDQCHAAGLPLVLEPLPRGLPATGDWVLDWVTHHADSGADLLKVPWPGSPAACARITAAADVPWVILSAGATFDTFVSQARMAMSAGARGYIAGRAVWREAATTNAIARDAAIHDHVVPRLARLAAVGSRPAPVR